MDQCVIYKSQIVNGKEKPEGCVQPLLVMHDAWPTGEKARIRTELERRKTFPERLAFLGRGAGLGAVFLDLALDHGEGLGLAAGAAHEHLHVVAVVVMEQEILEQGLAARGRTWP